ncbi:hypothetical protein AB1K70_19735 [Bremerella sp. JC770]|uniref:hypothetical protein n=1 Tax=Bremerella sp. JC770 TaxID=3232137 RepID=UPI00345A3C86
MKPIVKVRVNFAAIPSRFRESGGQFFVTFLLSILRIYAFTKAPCGSFILSREVLAALHANELQPEITAFSAAAG